MNNLFRTLGLDASDVAAINRLASAVGISESSLRYHNETNTIPSDEDLKKLQERLGIEPTFLMLSMGCLDRRMIDIIQTHAEQFFDLARVDNSNWKSRRQQETPKHALQTELGDLYQGDCLDLLANTPSGSIDLVFADPPFNLQKLYPSKISDDLKQHEYLLWCEEWARQCVRVLKPGGSMFVWNLPKWNTYMAAFLNQHLTFRHWISVDMKYSLPISGRLYPSHYSLLYYCKGPKPRVFHPDRLPMEVCSNCKADLRDYGGYKDRMNPSGVNLTDVWYDISPVRHAKYKKRKGANELPVRLLDRVIELASDPGDIVFDPFGGAGTTYVVAELKRRRWLGIELGPVDDILDRLAKIHEDASYLERIRGGYNSLFTDDTRRARAQKGLWTTESVRTAIGEMLPKKSDLNR